MRIEVVSNLKLQETIDQIKKKTDESFYNKLFPVSDTREVATKWTCKNAGIIFV